MADKEDRALESMAIEGEVIEPQGVVSTELGKRAFSKVQRELSDEDLKNPAVARILLDERERMLTEKSVLESFKDKYYEADKRAGVLQSEVTKMDEHESLNSLCQVVGGVLVGAVFSVQGWLLQSAIGLSGLLLILGNIAIKNFKRKPNI